MRPALHRYPRTKHLEGSAVQSGDEDMDVVSFGDLKDKQVVVTEKVDGANAAVSFTTNGRLLLQSRSRFLDEGLVEAGRGYVSPYVGFREWAQEQEDTLWPVLGDRYVMFGEWVLTKQTMFYDALPDSFLELDVFDTHADHFLSTDKRRTLLRTLPIATPPVLFDGVVEYIEELRELIAPSHYKTPRWKDALDAAIAAAAGAAVDLECERYVRETDPSGDMEGVVIKVEAGGVVLERAKIVRATFSSPFTNTSSQWLAARKVKNGVVGAARAQHAA